MDDTTAKELIQNMRAATQGFGCSGTPEGTLIVFRPAYVTPDVDLRCWAGFRTLHHIGHVPCLFEALVTVHLSALEYTCGVHSVATEGIWLNDCDGGDMTYHAHLIPWAQVKWLTSHAHT